MDRMRSKLRASFESSPTSCELGLARVTHSVFVGVGGTSKCWKDKERKWNGNKSENREEVEEEEEEELKELRGDELFNWLIDWLINFENQEILYNHNNIRNTHEF